MDIYNYSHTINNDNSGEVNESRQRTILRVIHQLIRQL